MTTEESVKLKKDDVVLLKTGSGKVIRAKVETKSPKGMNVISEDHGYTYYRRYEQVELACNMPDEDDETTYNTLQAARGE